ncbi:MAG: transcription/translation regulatory transformer protein RfaH [bacterium]
MNWCLIYTKPQQEKYALLNLERQGYKCYLPMVSIEKISRGLLTIVDEPLFPRYLFAGFDNAASNKSWSPIRSTKGVRGLVVFGTKPAIVSEDLINAIRIREGVINEPKQFFTPGELVTITDGVFAGVEAIYQMKDGESRIKVLIELIGKKTQISVSPSGVHKIKL